MPRYRKKPVEIEARQWDGTVSGATALIEWILENNGTARYHSPYETSPRLLMIDTLEGVMGARSGDYIIQGIQGEFYPCKPDIFEQTYDLIPVDGVGASGSFNTFTTSNTGGGGGSSASSQRAGVGMGGNGGSSRVIAEGGAGGV